MKYVNRSLPNLESIATQYTLYHKKGDPDNYE